ncbi:Uncharacterised protein [Mycobacterium tuberculosis]|nr:Uncharacterised protein [Mycobacterium tuberculosis]
MRTRPRVGWCRPAISARIVLFPQPDGPTIAVVVPGCKQKLTPSRTGPLPPS